MQPSILRRLLPLAVIAGMGLLLGACASLTPGQQATITTTEQTIATAAQLAAPLVSNKTISDSLYALAAVATAYGKAPVPTNIVQATTPLPGLAATVLPLVTGKSNGPKTQAIISAAAAALASLGGTAPAAPPAPTSP